MLELRAAGPGPERASPGTVLDRSGDTVAVATADGAVEVRVRPLAVDLEA